MNNFQLEAFVWSMLRDSSNTMCVDMMLLYLKHDHGLNLTFRRVRDMRIKVLNDHELLHSLEPSA